MIQLLILLICGDWGLGIGQSPIPNPQSPLYKLIIEKLVYIIIYNFNLFFNFKIK